MTENREGLIIHGNELLVVMGVAGAGKTTIGKRLARALEVPFVEADDYHDPVHLARMAHGQPLDDRQREPWLARVNAELHRHQATGAVVACSALTVRARLRLTKGLSNLRFVALTGDCCVIRQRLAERRGHPVGPSLLASQLASLDVPNDAITIDIDGDPDEVTERALLAMSSA